MNFATIDCYEGPSDRSKVGADLSVANNIIRRGATYHVRAFVPRELQSVIGKKEIHRSLRTTDPQEAKRLARAVLDELDAEWQTIRDRRTIEPSDIDEVIWERYIALVEADERFRMELPTEEDLDEIWAILASEFGSEDIGAYRILETFRDRHELDARQREARLQQLRQDAARAETKSVAPVVRREIEKRQLIADPSSIDYRRLSQVIVRAEIEALTRSVERDRGDWSGEIKDALVKPAMKRRIEPSETIMGQFDIYAKANPNNIKADTLDYSRKCVAIFADSLPKGYPASGIDKKAVREWHDLLRQFPVKAAEISEFRGLPIRRVVALNQERQRPTISKQTMNKYLSALGSFCNWLVRRGVIDINPTTGMHDKLDKDARPVRSYSEQELASIFKSPIYSGFLSDEKDYLPGNRTADDWRHWLPLLALFTGARLGELAQLLTDDVRKMHGHPVIIITREGDPAKSVKTKTSQRVIPVHPELERLGFLDFHARAAASA
ncbi:MAG: integrase [Rhizobiales bacterium]|nr:integrase [Hyphomicrobiales bacterium]